MLNKPKKDQQKTCGFTLIEVLVVIFIITIGLLAVFNVIQNITVHSRVAASRLTAVYLAQEGVEMIRNQRDSNWLRNINSLPPPISWDNNIPPPGCSVISPATILVKFNRNCQVSTTTEMFVIGGVPVSKDVMNISVGVSWSERGTDHSVTSTTVLYEWYK